MSPIRIPLTSSQLILLELLKLATLAMIPSFNSYRSPLQYRPYLPVLLEPAVLGTPEVDLGLGVDLELIQDLVRAPIQ